MLLTITYSPELNVFMVSTGKNQRVVAPDDLLPGKPLHSLESVFAQAKDAVVSGKAVSGICCDV